MARRISLLAAIVAIVATGALLAAPRPGETAPDFTLPDLDGEEHTLSDHRGKVVVLEWINPNCPFSVRHAEERTMISLADERDVVWLAVNSTAEGHKDYLEPAEHAEYNASKEIDYPVLYDTSGDVGRAYDAKTTPHMYVIDEEGTLIYVGAIDDDPYGREDAPTNYVADALDAHTGRAPVEPATTKPYGCSVKYGG